MTIPVVYSERQVADPGPQRLGGHKDVPSPSARKPRELAEALRGLGGIEFVDPEPVTRDDIKLVHAPSYVDGVLDLREPNGFDTISQSVADSLPYTNGAMLIACRLATPSRPACALVSGFHHACYDGWKGHGWFCTFNGLMIAAAKFPGKVLILDLDMHWGNGTDDILKKLPGFSGRVGHISFGELFTGPEHADRYLSELGPGGSVEAAIADQRPDLIIYQAGADVHVDDPYGGVLTTEQIHERDRRVFTRARNLGVPLAWNLAGGYQIAADGSIRKVIDIHLNTFRACREVYS